MKKFFLFPCMIAALVLTGCENESLDSNSLSKSESKITISKNASSKLKFSGTSVYVSSNSSGILGVFDVSTGLNSPTMSGLNLPYADADGVEYDANRDALYHVNRSDNSLVALANISVMMDGDDVMPNAVGPSSFSNGRGASLYNNKVVVVDDVTPGRLVSYHVNDDNISDFREYNVGFEVWDVHVNGKDLWLIEDVTNNVAYYKNFHNARSGDLSPTLKVAIEGIVRTHGLDYDASSDTMLLTDIGSAGSPTDGALVIIENFSSKYFAAGTEGMIKSSDQIRIEGDMTQLGNPVDVAISVAEGVIFVAERAQNKFLIFNIPTDSCNCKPLYATDFAGASSVTKDF